MLLYEDQYGEIIVDAIVSLSSSLLRISSIWYEN